MVTPTNRSSDGPYLAAAVICEKVLSEGDQVLSLIRLVDRFTIHAQGPGAPSAPPQVILGFSVVISLKAGRARGRHPVTLELDHPTGKRAKVFEQDVNFRGGDDSGTNLIAEMRLTLRDPGLHWIHVTVDGQEMTRIPFTLEYERSSGPTP